MPWANACGQRIVPKSNPTRSAILRSLLATLGSNEAVADLLQGRYGKCQQTEQDPTGCVTFAHRYQFAILIGHYWS